MPFRADLSHHVATSVDNGVRAAVLPVLRARGWRPRVVGYPGYGSAAGPGVRGWVRIFARVLVTPPGQAVTRDDDRGWKRFLTASAEDVPVTVTVGEQRVTLRSGRDGYVEERVDVDLPAGWARATFEVEGRPPVTADLRIVGPRTRLGLLSDIDDTVIVTMLPRPLVAFRNAFLVPETERRAVPGMAALYRDVLAAEPDTFVVYLSTGAWNVATALTRFLARHGFPPGPLLLTDWGPTEQTLFRSGREHKRTQLRRLLAEFPHLSWLLVGDDGQHDPSLYCELREQHPDRIAGIAIRQLSPGEQLASHGTPVPRGEGRRARQDPTLVQGPDGGALARALAARGIVLSPDADRHHRG